MKKQDSIIEALERRRQLFARILLSVHAGHLSAADSHTYNCVLCQFLTLPFIPAVVVGSLFLFIIHQVSRQWQIHYAPCSVIISHSQRGPPALF